MAFNARSAFLLTATSEINTLAKASIGGMNGVDKASSGGAPFTYTLGSNTGNIHQGGVEMVNILSADPETNKLGLALDINSDSRIGLIRYPGLAALPAGLVFGAGTRLRLFKQSSGEDGLDVGVQRLKVPFVANQADWTSRTTADTWAINGANGIADIEGSASAQFTVEPLAGTGYYELTSTQFITDIQAIYNGTAESYGHRLRALTAFLIATFSGPAQADGQRPELVCAGVTS